MGLPRLWLHRMRRPVRLREKESNRLFIASFVSWKTEYRLSRVVSAQRKLSLECRYVCLVGSDGSERIQSAIARACQFHFATARSGKFREDVEARFSKLPKISFDYAIMERADRVLVVEAGFDWDDVGSWTAVANYFKRDEKNNAANCPITAVDSTGNIVSDQDGTNVALLGVHNLIIVRTDDALLICHRHQAEKIKDLVGKIPPELQ